MTSLLGIPMDRRVSTRESLIYNTLIYSVYKGRRVIEILSGIHVTTPDAPMIDD